MEYSSSIHTKCLQDSQPGCLRRDLMRRIRLAVLFSAMFLGAAFGSSGCNNGRNDNAKVVGPLGPLKPEDDSAVFAATVSALRKANNITHADPHPLGDLAVTGADSSRLNRILSSRLEWISRADLDPRAPEGSTCGSVHGVARNTASVRMPALDNSDCRSLSAKKPWFAACRRSATRSDGAGRFQHRRV